MNGASWFERVRAGLWSTSLGPAVVIWGFGYLLVDIVAYLMDRSPPGLMLLVSLPMFVLGVCQTEAINMMRARLERLHRLSRALIVLAVAVAAATVQALFDLYWIRYLALTVLPDWQQWALQVNMQRLSTATVLYLWTFCLALTLLWAARASRTSEANAARAAKAEAAAAKAHSAALRLQLNPHFLFNTMNSISSLVALDRKEQAEGMIERLCDFLRASLNADPMEDVPLTQEIDAIDAYLDIEATRFGERLHIDIDVAAEATHAAVPNFILQPLVENAVKHGVSLVKGPARLSVAAVREGEELVLRVTNSVDPGARAAADILNPRHSTGIGLRNCHERLSDRYGEAAKLTTRPTGDGYEAVIRLPFIPSS